MLLLTGDEIYSLLNGKENQVIETVKQAYQSHAKGETIMPPNAYLHFPNMEKERIIAKPAYLGQEFNTAGIKWIASFPSNSAMNLDRASATLILNSLETGHPTAIMEGSVISAKRTAASAALAAQYLCSEEITSVGIIGCGLINFEIVQYLQAIYSGIKTILIFDLNLEKAEQFKTKCLQLNSDLEIITKNDFFSVLNEVSVLSIATTAVEPHINSLNNHFKNTLILHISLRDFTPDVVLKANNVVDDIDQVCSNNTSLHLTEKKVNNREFISFTIGNLLNDTKQRYKLEKTLTIFTPFGLGILDMAVAKLTQDLAKEFNNGITIPSFLPTPWLKRVN